MRVKAFDEKNLTGEAIMRTVTGAILLMAAAILLAAGLINEGSGRTERVYMIPYFAASILGLLGLTFLVIGLLRDQQPR
jgi:hypothetical protein